MERGTLGGPIAVRLIQGNRAERLLDALAADLAKARDEVGPFEPLRVVVPNRHVRAWVQLGIAARCGIAAQLELVSLARFASDLVRGARPDVRLVDATDLASMLLELLLDDERLAAAELAPVREWLRPGEGGDESLDVRRVQLASRLARLFEEYGWSRADWLARWPQEPVLEGTPYAATERWQRATWLALFGEAGIAATRAEPGERWLPLSAALSELPVPAALPGRVHVFGFSYLPPLLHDVLARIARRPGPGLALYAPNPCEEFWEDVASAGAGGEEPPLLALWGRPGREHVRRLHELAGYDVAGAFVDPAASGETLLARLQRDVLRRQPPPRSPDPALADGTIRLFACPGLRREAETIAGEIARLVHDDDGPQPLRLNEIAVVVAGRDREAYVAHLTAALRELHGLPHHVVDLPLARESRLAEAAIELFALPLSGFTRPDVLRVLTHPAVLARFPEVDPEEWVALVDRLGIVRGAGPEDHAGTYVRGAALHWEQGVQRLALGALLASSPDGRERLVPIGAEAWLPEEGIGPGGAAGAFALLVRSLVEDARFARRERRPIAEWIRFFNATIDAYLGDASQDDEHDRAACREALDGLARLDPGGRPVSYRIAHELAKRALEAVDVDRGTWLADGVVVSSLVPMRALPFRVVFVAGLGEGEFPALERRDAIDLRAESRRPGDVSDRERDTYALLETLLAARDRVHLSWVAREETTGEPLSPSPVVLELEDALRRYVGDEGLARLLHAPPVRRWDAVAASAAGDLPLPSPEARREAEAAAIGRALREQAGAGPFAATTLAARLPRAAWTAVAPHVGPIDLPDPAVATDEPVRLTVGALRAFLRCPLQGWARYRLGLEEADDGETAAREDEPFASDGRVVAALATGAAIDARRAGADPLALLASRRAVQERRGAVPLGPFGEADRRVTEAATRAFASLVGAVAPAPARLLRLAFGAVDEEADVDEVRSPVVLAVDLGGPAPVRVEIHGRTETLVERDGAIQGSLLLRLRAGEGPKDRAQRAQCEAIAAFLDRAMLAASGRGGPGEHLAWIACADRADEGPQIVRFAPATEEDARDWLAAVARDLLLGSHAYFLPCEAAIAAHLGGGDVAADVARLREADPRAHSSGRGPVAHAERCPPLADDVARATVERRFGSFFAAQLEEKSR